MQEFLERWIPNVMDKPDILWKSFLETMQMCFGAGILIIVFGFVLGTLLIITKSGGIHENKFLYTILDKVINFFRSIPFVILLAGLMPLSRLLAGTAIGVKGAIVPLVFGAVPFFSRQVESALAEVNEGLIEAAKSMGLSNYEIIMRVYFRESIPALSRGVTITLISLLGLTAMAGAIGAGGLGDFAIRYGHQRNQLDVTYVTVAILVMMVSFLQIMGDTIARRNRH